MNLDHEHCHTYREPALLVSESEPQRELPRFFWLIFVLNIASIAANLVSWAAR